MNTIRLFLFFFLGSLGINAVAQQTVVHAPEPGKQASDPYWHDWKHELGEGPIQDNSFLVEEAYNQEFGVAQNINAFTRLWQSKDWAYSFTQEWPVDFAPRNQLSYTMIGVHSGDHTGTAGGMGDTALNYRYQLVGNSDTRIAVAPRVSLLLPTGDSTLGRGTGGAGVQTNWAVSAIVNKRITTHFNAGATLIPHAKDADGNSARTYGYNLANSVVWNTTPRFNALVETVFYRNESVTAPGKTQWENQLLVSPGIRWTYNLSNGLQIVPGFAVPIGVGPSAGEKGIFLYLSLEHPYRRIPRKTE
jgi:hypothetical protein